MAGPEELRLPRRIAAELLERARSSRTAEICGLISGNSTGATRYFPIVNAAEEPDRLFALDARGQIEAMRKIRESREALLAIYHSHPRGPEAPSAHDIEGHAYTDAACVVLTATTLKAFLIAAGSATEIPVTTHDS